MNRSFSRALLVLVSLLITLWIAPDAAAWCSRIRTPQVGYIPVVETQPCNALFSPNGCDLYSHCPPGSLCETVLLGRKPCTPGTRTVPVDEYELGSPLSGPSGCCTSGVLIGPSPTATCVVPDDSVGNIWCFILKEEA